MSPSGFTTLLKVFQYNNAQGDVRNHTGTWQDRASETCHNRGSTLSRVVTSRVRGTSAFYQHILSLAGGWAGMLPEVKY